jgi:hypothetical protein
MTGDVASKTEPSAPAEQRVPTGYRVNLLPGALEICARLGTPEEVRNLIKVLRAGSHFAGYDRQRHGRPNDL